MGYLKGVLLLLALLGVGFYAFLASLVALLVSPVLPQLRYRANSFFLTPFGWLAKKIVGVRVIVLNHENILKARPAVLIGNHQSGMDLGIVGSVAPPGSVIVAKREIQNIPIFGWYFKIAGNLMIDRKKTVQAKNQMEAIRETLATRNLNLVIFPEGTRSKNQQMLPFKKGAFHLAIATGYPIIPVVCSSLQGKAVWETFDLKGGAVVISILPPMETRQLNPNDIDAFRESVRARMVSEFERVNAMAAAAENEPRKKRSPCCS